ncbi:helix-turn-helix transcriptional regulator [Gryllotalpicola sp.]|uniref:helix-turn-helix domain-containing protein n=1 Tax=Gryllotalpicola sp. TaxID=1932787 RepID=UPI00260167D4|nr:helix-turn-helix transcriptional regulator [Gryllotalpicola sp.]
MREYGRKYTLAIAAELDAARGRKHWAVEDVAKATGLTASTLRRYFRGEREINISAFIDICAALGVEPGVILHKAQFGE